VPQSRLSRPCWKRPACLEPIGDLGKAFVARRLGEARVHLGVLVRLAGDAGLEVVRGLPDRLAGRRIADLGEVLEVTVGVTGLALRNRTEQCRRVGIALDIGLLREPQVTPVGLALAGKCFLQVFVGLGAFEAHDMAPVWMWVAGVGRELGAQAAHTPWKTMSDRSIVKPFRPATSRSDAPST